MNKFFSIAFICILLLIITKMSFANPSSIRNTPIVKAIQKASPYVVSLKVTYSVKNSKAVSARVGSGVIFDGRKGYVITTAHVLKDAKTIIAYLNNGQIVPAKIVSIHKNLDIAILAITAQNLPTTSILGTSSDIMLGETVIAIGNPYGFENSITVGVISAISRSLDTSQGKVADLIQTDAAINPGNSGGPLINLEGKVIAINTIIDTRAEGIGFAIPIDTIRYIIQRLLAKQNISPVWLGVHVSTIAKQKTLLTRAPEPLGVEVSHIYTNSPAQLQGISLGDTIMRVNGYAVTNEAEYEKVMQNMIYPDTVKLNILRENRQIIVQVQPKILTTKEKQQILWNKLGLRVHANKNSLQIIQIDSNKTLSSKQFQRGDIILRIHGKPVRNIHELYTQIDRQEENRQFVTTVQRRGQEKKFAMIY